jgi:hypothetical protein
MNSQAPVINVSGDYEETILRLSKHLGRDKNRRAVFDLIYGRGSKPRSKKQIAEALGKAGGAQVVQNALDELAKHHLIVRIENNGQVKDGSRRLYAKNASVRANRDKIVRYADDPKAASKVVTKRHAVISNVTVTRTITRQELKKHKKLTVLYMLANPDPGPDPSKHIRPEAEARMVQEAVRASKFRDSVDIQIRVAADLSTMLDGLNDHAPQIVHFSGHSSTKSLAVDSGAVSAPAKQILSYELFAKALDATDRKPAIVVLNSCLSAAARKEVLKSAQAMIGMVDTISDIAAAAFAQQFYAALASGQSLASSFKQGVVAVEAVSLSEKATPQLFIRDGADPSSVVLT